MKLQIIIVDGLDAGQVFELETGELVLVGRGKNCSVQIHDPRVSKEHCRILAQNARLRIIDAGSSWSTYVNGNRVTESAFQPGDKSTLGETHLRVEVLADPVATTLVPPDGIPPTEPADEGDPGLAATVDFPAGTRRRKMRIPQVNQLDEFVGQRVLRYDVCEVVARARTEIVFRAFDTKKNAMWRSRCCGRSSRKTRRRCNVS